MSEDIGIEKRRGLLYQALAEAGRVTLDSAVALTTIENLETDMSINDIETARTAIKVQLDAQLGGLSQPTKAKPKQPGIASRFDRLAQSLGKPKLAVKVDPRAIVGIVLAIVAVTAFSYALRSQGRMTIKAPQAEETPALTLSVEEQVPQEWKKLMTALELFHASPKNAGEEWSVFKTLENCGEKLSECYSWLYPLCNFIKCLEEASLTGNLTGAKQVAVVFENTYPELKSAKITPSQFVEKVIKEGKQATPPANLKELPVPIVSPTKQPKGGTKSQPTNPPAARPTTVPTKVPTVTEVPMEVPTATLTPKPAPTLKVKALPAPKVAVYYVYPHKGSTANGVDTGLDRGNAFMTVVFWTTNLWGVPDDVTTHDWINRQLDSLGPGGGNLASIYDQIASKLPTPVPATAPYVFGAQGLSREQAFAMTVGWWRELRKEEPDVQVKDWLNKQLNEVGIGGDISPIYQKILAMSSKG